MPDTYLHQHIHCIGNHLVGFMRFYPGISPQTGEPAARPYRAIRSHRGCRAPPCHLFCLTKVCPTFRDRLGSLEAVISPVKLFSLCQDDLPSQFHICQALMPEIGVIQCGISPAFRFSSVSIKWEKVHPCSFHSRDKNTKIGAKGIS